MLVLKKYSWKGNIYIYIYILNFLRAKLGKKGKNKKQTSITSKILKLLVLKNLETNFN